MGDPFITASGKRVEQGTLACPRKYPFGTKVIIDQEIYDCRDRLALKYDDRFDIWMPSKKLALEWGKQIRVIKILE
jgi:3D (Asp-Asp-Asp) domain-containing protein